MITSPESNVVFTDEQTRQLETWKARLGVVLEELSAAEKARDSAKDEAEKFSKEKDYNAQLVSLETEKVESLRREKEYLQEVVKESKKLEQQHKDSNKKTDAELEQKITAIKEREATLHIGEETLAIEKERVAVAKAALVEEKEAVTAAKEAFCKAIETVVWR